MDKIGYLFEHRIKEFQRTDLYDVWPNKNCWICHGTGIAGRRVVHPNKDHDDGVRVIEVCGCLSKEEIKLKKSLEGNGRRTQVKESLNLNG
jgi:hypothetical protein